MTAYEFIKQFPILPVSIEGRHFGQPSGSEIRRWFKNKAIIINGKTPDSDDQIEIPVRQLIFFPNGRRRTTYQAENNSSY